MYIYIDIYIYMYVTLGVALDPRTGLRIPLNCLDFAWIALTFPNFTRISLTIFEAPVKEFYN